MVVKIKNAVFGKHLIDTVQPFLQIATTALQDHCLFCLLWKSILLAAPDEFLF